MSAYDPTVLPEGLPVPEDDGAADHLPGLALPPFALDATDGSQVMLDRLPGRVVVYAYPRTGRPDEDPLVADWDEIPGARGCTPESCAFRDHFADLGAAGASTVFGLSTQDSPYQREAAERLHLPFTLLSDADLELTKALRLPTFDVAGQTLHQAAHAGDPGRPDRTRLLSRLPARRPRRRGPRLASRPAARIGRRKAVRRRRPPRTRPAVRPLGPGRRRACRRRRGRSSRPSRAGRRPAPGTRRAPAPAVRSTTATHCTPLPRRPTRAMKQASRERLRRREPDTRSRSRPWTWPPGRSAAASSRTRSQVRPARMPAPQAAMSAPYPVAPTSSERSA